MLVLFPEAVDMAKDFLILMITVTRFSQGENLSPGVSVLPRFAFVGSFSWL